MASWLSFSPPLGYVFFWVGCASSQLSPSSSKRGTVISSLIFCQVSNPSKKRTALSLHFYQAPELILGDSHWPGFAHIRVGKRCYPQSKITALLPNGVVDAGQTKQLQFIILLPVTTLLKRYLARLCVKSECLKD